ncbi:tape measure protein [Sporosarcina sp. FA9]|uniref:tape measure protein n=1 Tax=Sporosarcina sp. FA9 TaxID=3413030 RepID=UPI003F65D6D8
MAADGQISIDITVDGTQVTAASTGLNTLASSANAAGGQTDALGQQTTKASMSIKDMAVSLGLVAVGAKAFSILKSSLDSAISRFDTLVGFPRIMEQMGFSSEQATKSLSRMSDGIQGLPTTLDGIVKSAQNIAIMTNDLDTATDTALALNNAFLASGSSSADAERGLTQYVQMLSKGSVDMMSWKTLQETMGYALNETAEAFGFAGKSAQRDLYAALKDGDITFETFNAKIIELSSGVGGFAEVALTSSSGIATSMQNLKNAVTVGVANMIVSFDNLSKATTGKTIAENMDGLKVVVKAAFTVIGKAIEGAAPIVTVFAATITALIPVVKTLTPVILGLTAAFATYAVIQKASTIIAAANIALKAAQATTLALTVATSARTAAQITMTTVDRAGTAVTVAQTGAVTLSTLAIGVMTGSITLATAAVAIKTTATLAWGAAIKFLMGPIGWIIAGIGLLVTGVIMLVKWFNKSTEEGERLGGVTDGLTESTKALNDSLEGSSSAYEKNLGNIESTAHANTDLISKIEELLAVEDKSGAQKKELESYVDSLNGSVEGLSLAYSKEANSLNLTSEEIANKIALMKEQETLTASQERFLAISKEQSEVDMKLKETNELRQEWIEKLEDGSVKSKEYKTAIAELDEQETQLTGTIADLGAQQLDTEKQITASIEAVAKATKESVTEQVVAYEFLEDSQKDVVDSLKSTWEDYKKQATDMFDKLSEKSKTTVSEMTKNLEENQRVMTNWSKNIATLAKRGIDEGLLDTLRSAGPESAGHVKALVNSSDAELMKLSDAFAKGGDVATSALSKSLGDNSAEVLEKVGHMVTQSGATLTQQIEKADFASLGKAMPEGTAKGVEEGTKEVTDATRKMAEDAEQAFRDSLLIKSPSGVFKKDGVHITEGVSKGVEEGIPKVVATMKKLHTAMIEPFANIAEEFQKIGGFAGDGLTLGLKNSESKVMATARNLANNVAATMRSALDTHSPSKVTTEIGVDTGTGLAVGMESTESANEKAILGLVKVITNTAKKHVDEVGKILAEGARSVSAEVAEINKKAAEESKKIEQRAAEDIALIYSKAKKAKHGMTQAENIRLHRLEEDSAAKVNKINEKAAADSAKVLEGSNKSRLSDITSFISNKKKLEQISLQDEIAIWAESVKRFKKGTDEKQEAMLALRDAKRAVDQEMLDSGIAYIDEKKRLGEISLADEIRLLDELSTHFAEHSLKFETIQKRKAQIIKQVNDNVTKINESYSSKMIEINKTMADGIVKVNEELAGKTKSINERLVSDTLKAKEELASKSQAISERLIADELRVNDELAKTSESRYKDILNSFGIFDKFDAAPKQTGDELLENMQSQVDGIKNWEEEITKLSHKAIDEGLLAELRKMGPKALPQLLALNSMTEDQLTNYSSLYQEKSALARSQAEKEMVGMKADTQRRLEELRSVANAELAQLNNDTYARINEMRRIADAELANLKTDAYNRIAEMRTTANEQLDLMKTEWVKEISKITKATDDELKSLKQIGVNAGKGLLDGLASMESSLVAKARSIAESVKSAMASALDIHSPSRWTRDYIAGNMALGFISGIDKNESKIVNAAIRFGELMKPELSDITIPNVNIRPFNPTFGGGGGSGSSSTDNRKTFAPQITNHFTPAESTPSESARKEKQMLQRLALEF